MGLEISDPLAIIILLSVLLMAVEGVVASLKAGRNCTALGSATMKLFAQRKVMSRIMEESTRSEDEQIEENITDA